MDRKRIDQCKKIYYIFLRCERKTSVWVDFIVYETIEPYLKEFNSISGRLAVLKIDTIPINIALLCIHAPAEVTDKDI